MSFFFVFNRCCITISPRGVVYAATDELGTSSSSSYVCPAAAVAITVAIATTAAAAAAAAADDDDKYEYADENDVAPAAHSLLDSEIDVCPKTSSIVVSASPVLTVSQNVTYKDIHGFHHLNIPDSLITR